MVGEPPVPQLEVWLVPLGGAAIKGGSGGFSSQPSGAILRAIATNLSQNVPVGHFVNFSEHKTCIRKLPASVNMYPEVKKIPRAQKAAGMLFP